MAIGQDNKGTLRLAEWIYAMAGILYVIDAFGPLFFDYGREGRVRLSRSLVTEGTLSMQVISASIYLIALVLLLPRWKDVIALLSRNKALVLFLGLILVSASWSELPVVTLRRSAALIGTTIFAIYLALRFKPSELLSMLALAFGLTAVENLLFVILVPDVAIHRFSNYGAWSGALGQKNIMGRTMVLGMLVLWAAAAQLRAHKTLIWGAFALAVIEVAMSQSRTSWIAAVCLVLAVPFLHYLRRSHIPMIMRIFLVAVVGLGGVAFLVLQYADIGLELIGRDSTFTGRTNIWEAAIAIGMERLLLGHGYRTFWTLGVTNTMRGGNGHNSFLDLWLELGFVGIGIFIAMLVIVGRRAFRRLTSSQDRPGIWYSLFLMFLVLFSMAAQVFPDHGTIPWVLYVVITLYLTPLATASQAHESMYRRPRAPAFGAPAPAE